MTAELKDVATIPPEINKYLAILSKDPGSMVFAPLAEAYRKIGMLDEAIATAQDGLKLHPNYVSGMVALGRAYFEKGLHADARETLEKVLAIAPDNIIAVNILEDIKASSGQGPEVGEQEEIKVEESPEEVTQVLEEIEELDELEELAEIVGEEAEEGPEDFPADEINYEAQEFGFAPAIEVKEVEEEEVKVPDDLESWGDEAVTGLDEKPGVSELFEPEVPNKSRKVEEKEARPRKEITTGTIADLYIKQGYFDKAIDIYQTLYDADPENDEIKNKLEELKNQVKTKEQVEVKEEIKVEKLVGAGLKPAPTEEAIDKDSENVTRLESWLKTIQSERRRG